MRVTFSEFVKDCAALTDKALIEPLTVTRSGRDDVVVLSVEEYERLKRRDRRVVLTGELSDEEIELIQNAEVPAEYAYLDEELKDWKP
jgi:PHD/YefM family antitoxin component YafN of YafNO toxin-antitoxin module